jgi:hypothetical protein
VVNAASSRPARGRHTAPGARCGSRRTWRANSGSAT